MRELSKAPCTVPRRVDRGAGAPAIGSRRFLVRTGLLAAVVGLAVPSCGRETVPTTADVVVSQVRTLPATPEDGAWSRTPVHVAGLIPQDMVEPRLLASSTAQVRVQAVTDGKELAFRLAWEDSTHDDLPGPARFCDACAVQIPAQLRPDLPAPQMGETGRRVEIAYWNSAWQAVADGRADAIESIYPRASVDHYPFQAPSLDPASPEARAMAQRYAPARALGNDMARPAAGATVQDLVAEGPGTLSAAASAVSRGVGRRTPTGWDVMIMRPMPLERTANLRLHVAFAVWDGGRDEVGARKMRSAWIPITVEETP